MQDMRHLNLFGKITRIRTRFCFSYNEGLVFCVPKHFVSKAVGDNGKNVKEMSEILRRKIKIIPIPLGIHHAKDFFSAIVSPVEFKNLEINDGEIIITAGSQSKAALIGRNKRRLFELQKIASAYFNKELRVV